MQIISWNIKADIWSALVSWERRKHILHETIIALHADVYCLQETKKNQLDFLMQDMKGYAYVGVGRDDGKEKGEHCPIMYNQEKMHLVSQGTFWLSDTPDIPSKGYDGYSRVCTWATFDDKSTKTPITIYNTHFPLIFYFFGKRKASKVLLSRINPDVTKPVIIAGDFNARPQSLLGRTFHNAGFVYGGDGRASVHMLTVPTMCIDAIYTRGPLRVISYTYIRTHRGRLYPSDHFGVDMVCERISLHP